QPLHSECARERARAWQPITAAQSTTTNVRGDRARNLLEERDALLTVERNDKLPTGHERVSGLADVSVLNLSAIPPKSTRRRIEQQSRPLGNDRNVNTSSQTNR